MSDGPLAVRWRVSRRSFLASVGVIAISASLLSVRPAYADVLDDIVKGLTQYDPGTPQHDAALEKIAKLSDDDLGKLAQKLVDAITNDADKAVRLLMLLFRLGLKAAPNKILAKISEKLSKALEKLFSKLMKIMKDPDTAGGWTKLDDALWNLGVTDENKRLEIIEKLRKKIAEEKEKMKKMGSRGMRSNGTAVCSFDPATGALTIAPGPLNAILLADGTRMFDPLVGGSLTPFNLYPTVTDTGDLTWNSLDTIVLASDAGIGMMLAPGMNFLEGNALTVVGGGTAIAGAVPDSDYDIGLPDIGSALTADWASQLGLFTLSASPQIRLLMEADLAAATAGFTVPATLWASYDLAMVNIDVVSDSVGIHNDLHID